MRREAAGRRDVTRASSGSGRLILEAEIAQNKRILLRILRPKMPGERQVGKGAIIGQRAFSDPVIGKNSAQQRRDARAIAARYRTKTRFFLRGSVRIMEGVWRRNGVTRPVLDGAIRSRGWYP